jgi:GNAT superfamily N-acetyltransferase
MSDGRRFTIRRLEPSDDRGGLDSGQAELDRFFQRFAGQNPFRHHLGVTDVAAMDDKIVGFVTVSVGEIAGENVAELIHKRLPAYPLPILRIARLATDRRCRGMGIGRERLRSMLELALVVRQSSIDE